MTTAAAIASEIAASLSEAEQQLVFLADAGPADLPAVVAIMARAIDSDADPRLAAGVAALCRIVETSLPTP